MQKIVSQLDAEGYFIAPVVADPSPREPGVYLIPAGAVDLPVPTVPPGKRARLVGQAFIFEDIPSPPPEPSPPAADANAVRIAQIDAALAEIDQRSIRPSREIASALASGQPVPPFLIAKLDALETEAVALRTEFRALLA
ncbi:hypothetical protein [Rhodocyclus gracilis]|uniref:Uncharacterized protein n=1 Tax=Rhodocyclus tenuis TaxID=1066 RepID=A0A6L5JSL2_RHOTE|nr:hypothetical protein [Rhodocyclus gracilis]MQY50189.1 hypothetical protein [Rhodocyclus gracilis]